MIKPPIPENEPLRLAALRALNILDTEAEKEFDDLVKLASMLCKTPISMVSLIDADRQWIKSSTGTDMRETPRDISFCGHAIGQEGIFIVPDALEDERFFDNPLVTDPPQIRFYAGMPIHSEDGYAVGTLCVIDTVPHHLSSEEQFTLEALSKQVQSLLKLRVKVHELKSSNSTLSEEIDRREKLEQELISARTLAEESARAKEIFLANMSHEIRTPMNAILGMSDQLAKTNLNENQKFYLSNVHEAADNLLVIIDDILDLSKIAAGKLNIENIGFELKQVIERAMHVMMCKAEEKGLLLTNTLYDTTISPVLIGDPHRLNQVLLNFLSNGIKFTERGTIDIQCKVIANNKNDQVIEIRVTDTGIGMEASFAGKLFQKFVQEDDSITRRYGGTGLGMSICKGIIDLMGGEIIVQSRKNHGTTIILTLRFVKGNYESLPVKEAITVDTTLLKGKKILVADDNEMNRLVATHILVQYEVATDEAKDGKEAIDKLKTQQFDAVLMDVQMPEMDGVEAAAIIRESISKTLPVIALTAMALKGDDKKLLQSGMTDYVSKPFNEKQLLQVLTRNLQAASAEDAFPLYDLGILNGIANGNKSFVAKMIGVFLQQGPSSVAEIKEAYQKNDVTTVKKIAHRLKPSIDNMGIASIKDVIRQIESYELSISGSEALAKLIQQLDKKMQDVTNALKQDAHITSC